MVTAAARTNAIGRTISGIDSALDCLTCKTDHFKIFSPSIGDGAFLDEGEYKKVGMKQLGLLLNHENNTIQLMAQILSENGHNLREVVYLYKAKTGSRSIWEIRTNTTRYRAIKGRLYEKRLYANQEQE